MDQKRKRRQEHNNEQEGFEIDKNELLLKNEVQRNRIKTDVDNLLYETDNRISTYFDNLSDEYLLSREDEILTE